jgi:aminoglycoside phosphotransferase
MTATTAPALVHDPAVPTRDALLDPTAFARAVERAAGGARAITGCTRRRARYQPGRSLRVLYALELEHEPVLVAARTFPTDLDALARRWGEGAIETATLPPVFALHDLGAVAWVYPNDRKLPALPLLEETVAALLRRSRVRAELVAWAPEKSATVRCDGVYAKTYADATAVEERRLHEDLGRRLSGNEFVAVPRVVASSDCVLVAEAASGTRLAQIDATDAGGAFRRFALAIAQLHALAPLRNRPGRNVLQHVVAAADLLGRVRPDVAVSAASLARKLARRRPRAMPAVCIHGDAHPKNAVDDGARVTLIDLEQVAAGDPTAELGSVLAAITYRSVAGESSAADDSAAAFLDGYESARPLPPPASLAWHEAAALLSERSFRAVTRVRDAGLHNLDALLGRAHETLDGVRP